MVAYTALFLFLAGIFGNIKISVKADRALAFPLLAGLAVLFFYFCRGADSARENAFSFIWSSTPGGRSLNFDIVSDAYNCMLIIPCFAVTLLSAAWSLIFRYEARRCAYISLLALNLAALIMLVTASNFVQLLTALFVIDVLAVFVTGDASACRRFVMFNLAADMLLFAVMAVINSRVASLDIRQIVLYRDIGAHQDFVALAGLAAVFAKAGFFPFCPCITGLGGIRLHRLYNILFLSSPFAAVILLLKFYPLWETSAYFGPCFDAVCVLTMIWGALGVLCRADFKVKTVYLYMMSSAFFLEMLHSHGFVRTPDFSFLSAVMYAAALVWYLFYYYCGLLSRAEEMFSSVFANRKPLFCTLLLFVLAVAAEADVVTTLRNAASDRYIWLFAVLFYISITAVLRQLFTADKSASCAGGRAMPVKITAFAGLAVLCVFLMPNKHAHMLTLVAAASVFVLLCAYNPLSKAVFLYKNDFLQSSDVLGAVYTASAKFLRLCGKLLRMLTDRLLMEKIVFAPFSSAGVSTLRLFRKLHSSVKSGGILAVLLLAALLLCSYISAGGKL